MTAPIAVVGAGGFLGRAVVHELGRRGVATRTLTRATPIGEALTARAVVWAATSVTPLVAEQRPDLVAADLVAFDRYLAMAASLPEPPRTVLIGSGGTVYDDRAAPPYSEVHATSASSAYAASRLELERRLAGAGLPGCVVRVANAYGPGQLAGRGQGVLAYWMDAVRRGRPVPVLGDTATARDFVYVADVAEALATVATVPDLTHRVVNVGSGRPTSLAELLDVLAAAVGRGALATETTVARRFDRRVTYLDVSRANEWLGWAPTTSLAHGVRCMWAWWRERT